MNKEEAIRELTVAYTVGNDLIVRKPIVSFVFPREVRFRVEFAKRCHQRYIVTTDNHIVIQRTE